MQYKVILIKNILKRDLQKMDVPVSRQELEQHFDFGLSPGQMLEISDQRAAMDKIKRGEIAAVRTGDIFPDFLAVMKHQGIDKWITSIVSAIVFSPNIRSITGKEFAKCGTGINAKIYGAYIHGSVKIGIICLVKA
ncbi:MAG: hypothetical protein WC838_00890 [Candidatus Margulisiibacteriota bacterium]|jgi:hypothetical protein